jgi:hypothetical protein
MTLPHINNDQIALLEWITAGLQIEQVRNLNGDAGYLLNNMIAKYSLAAGDYLLSQGALLRLERDGVDLTRSHKRSRLYGKQSPYLYEHSIPASLVRARLLNLQPVREDVAQILAAAGPVAMLLREEDDVLRRSGMRSSMPVGWRWGDDPLARYRAAGITMAEQTIRIEGKICR